MTDAKKLLQMKEKIEKKIAEKNRMEGESISLQKRLVTDHSCKNVEEAKKKLAKLQKEIEKGREQFSSQLEKLERAHEW